MPAPLQLGNIYSLLLLKTCLNLSVALIKIVSDLYILISNPTIEILRAQVNCLVLSALNHLLYLLTV